MIEILNKYLFVVPAVKVGQSGNAADFYQANGGFGLANGIKGERFKVEG
jgi:hypothetical protein